MVQNRVLNSSANEKEMRHWNTLVAILLIFTVYWNILYVAWHGISSAKDNFDEPDICNEISHTLFAVSVTCFIVPYVILIVYIMLMDPNNMVYWIAHMNYPGIVVCIGCCKQVIDDSERMAKTQVPLRSQQRMEQVI